MTRFWVLIFGILFSMLAYYLNTDLSFIFGFLGLVFILIGLLVASRSPLLGFGKDMRTINGIGTTLYGKSDFDPTDKSYISTKWYVFLGLPIIPLRSYRVTLKGDTKTVFFGTNTDYQMLDVPIKISQIIKTYILVYGIIASIIAIILFSN